MSSLKEKAEALLERTLVKKARVLQTRPWPSGNMVEADLHLPETDMSHWKQVPHIKIKVAPLTYRDYTPCGWDAETRTCTLFISTRHQGKGSQWARSLEAGQQILYLGTGATPHRPSADKLSICFGDQSAIGHFMGLKQLASDPQLFCGAVMTEDSRDREWFAGLREPFDWLFGSQEEQGHAFLSWLDRNRIGNEDATFYLAGRSSTVAQMRKSLKQRGYDTRQIKAQGFWS